MKHVVTGATGLVGAALVLELPARTDDEVVCLVRPGRKVGPGLGVMFEKAGLPRPVHTDDVDGFTQLEREFDRKIEFYGSYRTGNKRFDQKNPVDAVGDPAPRSWRFELARYLDWYRELLAR